MRASHDRCYTTGDFGRNDHGADVADADQPLEVIAAELAAAAYSVALRHVVGDRWLDLQLELWRVLAETLKQWGKDCRVGLGARDPAALAAFYRDVLGLQVSGGAMGRGSG
jgi:hypothetical protein